MIQLDDWQEEILRTSGNKLLVSGRQVGKSTIIAIDAGNFVMEKANKSVLIISSTERQAQELFIKCINYISGKAKHLIKTGKERPTKHIISLKNGSIIRCLPTGLAGTGIRGYTIHRLIADEAAFIPDEVFYTVTPMLLTTAGDIILVSTPHGRSGYFYECYNSKDFKIFHINSEEVIKNRPIGQGWTMQQREGAIAYLEREKGRMSHLQYAQEYLGQFVDQLRQYFLDSIIRKCCVLKRPAKTDKAYKHYMGVDLARMGEDESVFSIVKKIDKGVIKQVENIITRKTFTTDSERKIKELAEMYGDCLKEIGIDAGAGTLGVSVLDHLKEESVTMNKVIALNNAKRSLDREGKNKVSLFKEDLYDNLRAMMERGEIELLDDDEIKLSLKSVQYEYSIGENRPTSIKIFGAYTHCAEGIIRAAWLANAEKHLNLWCYYSN